MKSSIKKILILALVAVVIGVTAWAAWKATNQNGQEDALVSGNGRIEATEIDTATKFAGRVVDIFVREGDFVKAGQVVAQMQSNVLEARLEEARANRQEAIQAVAIAKAQVAMRQSDVAAAQAIVVQRQAQLDNANGRLERTQALVRKEAATKQKLDDDTADKRSAEAALNAAKAQVKAAQAAVEAADAQIAGARFKVEAVNATIARIEADLADSQLKAPRDGRVQYRVAEPGEVLGAGGKVLNMVDLNDVYMTFFLPETVVGKVALDSEVRIVLDALQGYVIPARVSFVSSVAQFTPKTVETTVERQKLMFRVKARIDPNLLKKHILQVKTGLPGVAWLKLDLQSEWPQELAVKVPE
ncbi:MAG: HlyD family secretion protein [Alphaproteobacteria bacterium]